MNFLLLILALVPLAWAVDHRNLRPRSNLNFQKDCHYDCPTEKLAKCECENANALRCAGPTERPFLKHCASSSPIYPTATKTLRKTRKHPKPTAPAPKTKTPPSPITSHPPTPKGPPTNSPIPKPTKVPTTSNGRCGSRGLTPCFTGETCIDDPFDPSCKTALDCPGYCVRLNDSICGPVFGIACPSEAQLCVNDPRDDCTTEECPGTCVVLDSDEEVGFA